MTSSGEALRLSIEGSLEVLRAALDADGFTLTIENVNDVTGIVHVSLTAAIGACIDCLVPDAMITQIVENAVKNVTPDFYRVVLDKVGFGKHEGYGGPSED